MTAMQTNREQIYTELESPYFRVNPDNDINMSNTERRAAMIGGGALMSLGIAGLIQGKIPAALLAALGGVVAYQGITGRMMGYRALGINHAELGLSDQVSVPHEQGIKVVKTVTIGRSPMELYNYWRNFENLPRFMSHLESVEIKDSTHSHWKAKAPAGMTVEWDAEIINEVPYELIGWRSLEGSDIPNAGSVTFKRAPNGRGTILKVSLEYAPPAGKLGSLIAKLFGEEPEIQIQTDIMRFKQLMETGEVASTHGQPSGRD
jgi:uncharacterized membrane protein